MNTNTVTYKDENTDHQRRRDTPYQLSYSNTDSNTNLYKYYYRYKYKYGCRNTIILWLFFCKMPNTVYSFYLGHFHSEFLLNSFRAKSHLLILNFVHNLIIADIKTI